MHQETRTYTRNGHTIDTDPFRLDLGVIHGYLTQSYWSPGVPRDVVEKAIADSLCFGLYNGHQQIGFARVVTDYPRFAYLCDLFVLEDHRGQGLGKWLVECAVKCDLFEGIRVNLPGNTRCTWPICSVWLCLSEYPDSMMEIKFEMPWFRPELSQE